MKADLLRRGTATLLALAGLVFVALTLQRNWSELQAYDWSVSPPRLVLSTLGLTLVLSWGIFVWARVLKHFGDVEARLAPLTRIWFVSNLARYIPGKIWQFVGAAQMARSRGYSAPLLLTSLAVHAALNVVSAAMVAGLTLPFYDVVDANLGWLAPAGVAAAALLVHPRLLNRALSLVPRALHREVLTWRGRWRDGILLLLLATISWLLYGGVFYLFLSAVAPVPASVALPLIGVNALAFLAGYLVFLVPAGIGVREAALALLLRPFAPAGVAALVAVLSRLWIIAAELIGAAASMILRSRPSA